MDSRVMKHLTDVKERNAKWKMWVKSATDEELRAEIKRLKKLGAEANRHFIHVANGTLAQRHSPFGMHRRSGPDADSVSSVKSVRASVALWTRCIACAERQGLTLAEFVRQAMENECLEHEEDKGK